MSCNNLCCSYMKPVPNCTDTIVIGTVAISTDYWIWVTSNATGKEYRYESTSDINGVLSLDLLDKSMYMDGYDYTVRVSLKDSYDYEQFTISDNLYTCVTIPFYSVVGGTDSIITLQPDANNC